MPSAISALACGYCSSRAMSLPSAAPIASEGAKIPAGTPDQGGQPGGDKFEEEEHARRMLAARHHLAGVV
jgi:hypothetical protein